MLPVGPLGHSRAAVCFESLPGGIVPSIGWQVNRGFVYAPAKTQNNVRPFLETLLLCVKVLLPDAAAELKQLLTQRFVSFFLSKGRVERMCPHFYQHWKEDPVNLHVGSKCRCMLCYFHL